MKAGYLTILILCTIGLTGCGGADRALFVTNTVIGIDADAKAQDIAIGYDRYEGFAGPAYAGGGIPPVIARLESNLNLTSTKINQLYATGNAAKNISTTDKSKHVENDEEAKNDSREVMYFGTGTNFGLRVSFAGSAPDHLSLGYKRREFSLIPVIDNEPADGQAASSTIGSSPASTAPSSASNDPGPKYGSVLASFNLDTSVSTISDTAVQLRQFFATGTAASRLAAHDNFKPFRDKLLENPLKEMSNNAVRASAGDDTVQALRDCMNTPGFDRTKLIAFLQSQNPPISATDTAFYISDDYTDQRKTFIDANCTAT